MEEKPKILLESLPLISLTRKIFRERLPVHPSARLPSIGPVAWIDLPSLSLYYGHPRNNSVLKISIPSVLDSNSL